MPDRTEIRTISCAARVTQANAVEVDLSFPPGRVRRIDVHIPQGHRGNTGIALAQAHQVIIPASGSAWIIGDGDTKSFEPGSAAPSGNWQAMLYNLDRRAHQWDLHFHIDELDATPAVITPQPLDARRIYSASGGLL